MARVFIALSLVVLFAASSACQRRTEPYGGEVPYPGSDPEYDVEIVVNKPAVRQ
ncbi:MAG: hypothetical protein J5J00_10350 [Deltaproteobacteria bacterium]|nr:hypothetical protein [Deltaproteobacteria bacterium]